MEQPSDGDVPLVDVEIKQPSEIQVFATVIRANGTVEDLGLIDARYEDEAKQLKWLAFDKPLADERIRLANQHAREQ